MRSGARERPVPVTSEPSLDLLFDGLLHQAATRGSESALKLRDWVSLAEAWRISHALRECRGNRTAAARILGIGRRTLYSKMEKLGISSSFTIENLNGIAGASHPGWRRPLPLPSIAFNPHPSPRRREDAPPEPRLRRR